MKPTILLYSHTDYKDIWPIFFGQINTYLPDYKKVILVNKFDCNIQKDYKIITYEDKLQYTDRLAYCLKQMEQNEVVLFLHEDMILYKQPNCQVIEDFVDLVKNDVADFIRLNKSSYGKTFIPSSIHKNLLLGDTDNLFCIQPTICKVESLQKVFSLVPNFNIWNFESIISSLCIKNNLVKSFMTSDINENKRGLYHWDSNIFPYIATAVEKGKWNYSEYNDELTFLHNQYNIDKNLRGTK